MKQTMKINEVFFSLQGEGPQVGLPTIFIRTAGCNLRCSYCDTTYAYYEGTDMTVPEIMQQLERWSCTRVCLTGGEPLIQENLPSLLDAIMEKEVSLSVETNGSLDITPLTERKVTASVDWKCPSSGMHEHMVSGNLGLLRTCDVLKVIIADWEDYIYAKQVMEFQPLACQVVMQPVGNLATELANWIITDGLEVRLSVQLHKLLWGHRRGV